MHTSGNKRYLNLNVGGLFLQETYTSTETGLASMKVAFRGHHSGLGLGGLLGTAYTKWQGSSGSRFSESGMDLGVGLLSYASRLFSV